ncbi:tRNA (adenosine(37)-N6)-threonylcarbamoyltransferase complex dimerization subunit type 1 TsaB [Alloscardovia venturai]|uniref:tRNA (Adenosine(37)-N6)-threonylcarbamoyltransferase complex dimerization subunit type 1 TsaB n=1 Tax=Alloscardovia venturai TaxID=1769421 RepID=A0ABW2Y3I1_9BIFI
MTFIPASHMVTALHALFDADMITSLYSEPTLVIDTSYGSTVGIVGYEPLYEADSRSHVELLEPHIARVMEQANLTPHEVQRIIVGTGPAPFTGLRAGIVAARAMAFATHAQILGMDVLSIQNAWNRLEQANMAQFESSSHAKQKIHYTLAVNDARRKQLYFALYDDMGNELLAKDIDFAEHIAERVVAILDHTCMSSDVLIDIIGHGATKYKDAWTELPTGEIREESVLHDAKAAGLAITAACAVRAQHEGKSISDEPLYLRRPDVTIPAPQKHILGQTAISMPVGGRR